MGRKKLWDERILLPLASETLEQIDAGLLTYRAYPDNYHENFNELNRERIFAEIGAVKDRVFGLEQRFDALEQRLGSMEASLQEILALLKAKS